MKTATTQLDTCLASALCFGSAMGKDEMAAIETWLTASANRFDRSYLDHMTLVERRLKETIDERGRLAEMLSASTGKLPAANVARSRQVGRVIPGRLGSTC